jgi:hypothetical protein
MRLPTSQRPFQPTDVRTSAAGPFIAAAAMWSEPGWPLSPWLCKAEFKALMERWSKQTKNRLGRLRVRAIMHLLTDPMFYICMLTNFTVIYLTALAGSGRDNGSVDDFVD